MVNLMRAIRFTVVFSILLGLIYPLAVVAVGRMAFPFQASGSMEKLNGQVVGSKLIAQSITTPGLFHPRPSAVHYAANGSGGSNFGPTNPALVREVQKNLRTVEQQNPGVKPENVPTDMVESSASGLDPDISIRDALIQVPRIADTTGLTEGTLRRMIQQNTRGRFLGIWGEQHVNVLLLDLEIQKKLGR